MSIAKDLLDSIDILAADKVSSVKFDKTVRATIADKVDESIGKYKVKYQNSTFYAYDLNLKGYAKNTKVYVVIPSSDFEKDPYILGPVTKNASTTQTVINPEDRMSLVGTNVITQNNQIGFASYKSNDIYHSRDLIGEEVVSIDEDAVLTYQEDTEYLLIGATFKTSLDSTQKIGRGDYGIKVVCQYYDPSYKSNDAADEAKAYVFREYTLNIDRMTGQPFNYVAGSDQYAIFNIDSEHLKKICSVTAFCKDFPNEKIGNSQGYYIDGHFKNDKGQEITVPNNECIYDLITKEWYQCKGNKYYVNITDITISNIRCEFLDALTEEELQGLSLRITTPLGGFFYTQGEIVKPESLQLYADLRVKGKKVNYNEQKANFYWFVKDARVNNQNSYYQQYGGIGWRCLNNPITGPLIDTEDAEEVKIGKTSFAADTYTKTIYAKDCLAYENIYKCVALFKQDNETIILSTTITILNKVKQTQNNIWISSSMGTDFAFNEGITELICNISEPQESYSYYWTKSVDGGSEELLLPDVPANKRRNVSVGEAHYFVTYTCSVYDQNNVLIGTAAITLNNGEPTGQFKLVLNNGTQVFKYNADGISPASPSVDELDRIELPVLSFDIYNDKGQLVNLGNDNEKVRKAQIKWIWPSTSNINPTKQTEGFESMLLPAINPQYTYTEDLLPSPSDNNFIKRWVVQDQARLVYNIQNTYDIEKTNNNIILEVDYQGQHLVATTNFTFTKEGELGTNGTKYTTRIIPKSSEYSKIVIGHPSGLYGLTAEGKYKKINDNMPFKVQIWDGGINFLTEYDEPNDSRLTWSTELDGRKLDDTQLDDTQHQYMTIGVGPSLSFNIRTGTITQNHTLKVTVNDSDISSQPFYAIYPLDLLLVKDPGDPLKNYPEYNINGGYRSCNYESDGTRSAFTQKPFTLTKIDGGKIDPDTITWTNNWNGCIYTEAIDSATRQPKAKDNGELEKYNTILVEPPDYYIGSDVNNYITCAIDGTIVAVIPIEFYLNRYGLAAMNGWDGVSLKLNTEGTNYILAPQMGAGKKENDGSFTGIVAGTSMEDGSTNTGLFGYHKGGRTIFLDAETGNAEFGKAGAAQIKIDATTNEGIIQSGDYDPNEKKTGMKIKFSSTGFEGDEGPYIKFGSGNFSVDTKGNLVAQGSGSIAGWNIGNSVLSGGTMFLDKKGIIGGGSNGSYSVLDSDGKTHNNLRWYINDDGIATFSDIRITNSATTDKTINTTILDINNGKSGTNKKSVTIDSAGTITANNIQAEGGQIGGWTINDTGIHRGTNFDLNNSGSVQLGTGFSASSASMSGSGSMTGSTGGGSFSGRLNSNAGSSILNNAIGNNNYNWKKDYKLVANLQVHQVSIPTGGYVSIDGHQIPITLTSSGSSGAVISSYDIYNADFLGSASKQ